jgi:hypothetical protein
MNTKIEQLMIESGLACDGVDSFDAEALNNFVAELLESVFKEIESTPNHHCFTTWDVGFSEGTKQVVIRHLKGIFL